MLSVHHTKPGHAFTTLILEVFRLNGRLLTAGDALTRPAQQTSARWQVLGALDQDERTVADIGRRMGLTRQSVQRIADLLEADGLVAYRDNPAHQRAKLAVLTPRGRAVLDDITARQIEWANRIASRLADDDLTHAVRILQQVRQALDSSAASPDSTTRPARSTSAPRRPRGAPRKEARNARHH
jgi:DNA-binding MarR family transcriptional regulator